MRGRDKHSPKSIVRGTFNVKASDMKIVLYIEYMSLRLKIHFVP